MFKKYKWLYLWASAAIITTIAILMALIPEFGEKVVLYIAGIAILIMVIIRLIPFTKTTRNNWALAINIAEFVIDAASAVVLFILAIKYDDSASYRMMFPMFLGGVLYLRGFVYFLEIGFFGTKNEAGKFFAHLGVLTLGTWIFARWDNFEIGVMRWVIFAICCLCACFGIVDGIINYNNYRKLYRKKEVQKEEQPSKEKEEPTIIAPADSESENKQDYVN